MVANQPNRKLFSAITILVMSAIVVLGHGALLGGPMVNAATPTPPGTFTGTIPPSPTPGTSPTSTPSQSPTGTPLQSPTPPPGQSSSQVATVTNFQCVAGCSGVQINQIQPVANFFARQNTAAVNIQLLNNSGGRELSTLGVSSDTRFQLSIRVNRSGSTPFNPQTLVVIGNDSQFISRSAGDPATASVEFGTTSGSVNFGIGVSDPNNWPKRNITATKTIEAVGIVNIAEVSGGQYNEMNDVVLSTNAQVFDPPTYQPPQQGNPSIKLNIAAPHFETNGQTVNTGQFRAFLPDKLLSKWGVNANQLTATAPSGGGTIKVTQVSGGVEVSLTDYHYSSGNVTVTTQSNTTDTEPGSGPEIQGVTAGFAPVQVRANPGKSTTVDLQANNIDNGIKSYSYTATVSNTSVATITGVELVGASAGGLGVNVTITDDNSTAIVSVAQGDDNNGTFSTLTLSTQSAGTADLQITQVTLGDDDFSSYNITGTTNATIKVSKSAGPPAVVGNNRPTDPDGDGKFDDVTGDGTTNILDVGALLQNRNSPGVQNNPTKFDFTGDGTTNILDVGKLLQQVL